MSGKSMFRIVCSSALCGATLLGGTPQSRPPSRPLVFEPHRGQSAREVKWLARESGYQLFVTDDSAVFVIQDGPGRHSAHELNKAPLLFGRANASQPTPIPFEHDPDEAE